MIPTVRLTKWLLGRNLFALLVVTKLKLNPTSTFLPCAQVQTFSENSDAKQVPHKIVCAKSILGRSLMSIAFLFLERYLMSNVMITASEGTVYNFVGQIFAFCDEFSISTNYFV